MADEQLMVRPPANIRRLPFDGESFTPWFAIGQKVERAPLWPHPQQPRVIAGCLCWLCGRQRGERGAFVVSLRGALERQAWDPPAHYACATYAATVWFPEGRLGWFYEAGDKPDPRLAWLASPEDERRGIFAKRIVCLWQTDRWRVDARSLALTGDPLRVEWYENGAEFKGAVPFDPDSYLGALAERKKLAPLIERLRPWLP